MEIRNVTISLIHDEQIDGTGFYRADYEPEDMRDLCLALLSDADLRKLVLHATAYILAQHGNAEETIGELRRNAENIRNEILKQ